jgi:acetyltransferase-like isoleucine patch superfamily enzyme
MWHVGSNTKISDKAKIVGIDGISMPKRFVIGDNSYIGDDVQIICDDVEIGDYCKIHHHSNIHGYLPFKLGHNAWIGQYTILDSIGGLKIGNNFCLSSQSQLWTHFKFGDCLEGCRFNSSKEMIIGDDVWIGVQCIVTPITIENKSMLLGGSIATKDMKYNCVYAGSPAIDISNKLGNQFKEVSIEDKIKKMNSYLKEFGKTSKIIIVSDISEIKEDDNVYFSVKTRQYTKKLYEEEVSFMKFLLPTRAKFTPL